MRSKAYFFDSSLGYFFWGRFNQAWAKVFAVLAIALALTLIFQSIVAISISRQQVFLLTKQRETFNAATTLQLKSAQLKSPQNKALSTEQRVAVKAVLAQLNISWHQLFEQLEKATPEGIAILSIEPDGKNSLIKFQAEAASLDSLFSYAASLQNSGIFGQLNFSKHETLEQESNRPNQPVRLSFELELLTLEQLDTPSASGLLSAATGKAQ